jgi:hypothetical protein
VGISDEGCQQLRTIRRADPACWDIPLHGLLNRRAYLIESASRNRYVPKLVDAKTPVTTVICIPMFAGMTPLGSIVIVAASPRVFTQRDIERLWTPLRALAAIIEEIRRRVTVAAPSGDLPPIDRAHIERSALAAERDQLLSELAARRAEGEKLAAALEEQIGTAARLRAELEASRSECQRLEREVGQGVDLAGTDEAVRAHVARLEHERDELATSLGAAETKLREAHDEAAARDRDRRRNPPGPRGRRGAPDRACSRTLEQELAAAASGSDASEALAARIEDLETRLAAASQRGGRGAGGARCRRRGDQRALEAETAALRTRCEEATTHLDARDAELAARDQELTACGRSATARGNRRRRSRPRSGRCAPTIETLTSERDVAVARAGVLEDAEASLARDRERIGGARAAARRGARRDERRGGDRGERNGGAARGERPAAGDLREPPARVQRSRQPRMPRPSSGSRPACRRRASVTLGVTSMFASDLEAAPDEAVTVISVPPEPLTPVIEHGTMPLLVVIDSDQAWQSLEIDGYEVYVAAPDTDAAAAVAALDPAHIVANLASGVMNTLGALRKAGRRPASGGASPIRRRDARSPSA